jgi:capsular polysaccharide biosynthesis protein
VHLASDYSGRAMGNPHVHPASLRRRWWRLILVATVGCALVAYVVGSRVSPTYEASSQALIQGPAGLAPTYAELVKSTPVLVDALNSVKPDVSLTELRRNVRGESDQNTRIVTIDVDADKKRDAIALANAIAAGLRSYVQSTQASSAGTTSSKPIDVQLVDPADSAVRVRPLTSLLLLFGAAVGLLGGTAFALAAEARSPKVTAVGEFEKAAGLPVLGSVNGGSLGRGGVSLDPIGALEDAAPYRRLATQIAVANESDSPRSLVVVGADGPEGSRAVAVRLAHVLALEGRRVVLADFEGDMIKRSFGIGERAGAHVMRRMEPLKDADMVVDRFALRSGAPLVLACGRFDPQGLSFERAEELVLLLSADADLLIVHAPPPSSSRAALTWARATEATVLVVRGEKTKQEQVAEALAGLESARTKLVGAVLQR